MLYIVGTPIGNLKDISFRAVEVLKEVDEIACEDTRHTIGLLNAYGIKKPLVAYHKFNEKAASEKIADKLESGKNIALVTDAGMPLISDPGGTLIKTLIQRNLEYTVVPGASAFLCALVMSGLLDYRFCFIGFLPEKKSEKKRIISAYKDMDCPLVFYCAPQDVDDFIAFLYSELGDRTAVSVREITKTFETREQFRLSEGYGGARRGEFVIVVEGANKNEKTFEISINEHIALYMARGFDKKEAIKAVAKERGLNKNEVYKHTIAPTSDDNE